MVKDSLSKMFELGYSIVRKRNSLCSFITKDPDSYLCRLNHVHIVSSIPYSESDKALKGVLDESHHFTLLARRAPIHNPRLRTEYDLLHVLLSYVCLFLAQYPCHSISGD